MIKYILLWFLILITAIVNGIIREAFIKKFADDSLAHQLSTFTLLILMSGVIWFIIKQWPPKSAQQTIYIGILWVIMTLAFEFGFGYYRGNSWSKMLEDYNLLKGRIWMLIPIWVAIAPYLFYRFKRNF